MCVASFLGKSVWGRAGSASAHFLYEIFKIGTLLLTPCFARVTASSFVIGTPRSGENYFLERLSFLG